MEDLPFIVRLSSRRSPLLAKEEQGKVSFITSPSSPLCEGGERGVVISSSCPSLLNLYVFPHATLFVLLAAAAGTGAVSSDLWRLLCGWFQKLFGFILILTLHFFFSFYFPAFLPSSNILFIIKRQPVAGVK